MIRVIRLAVPLVAVVAACSRPPVARDTQSDTYAVYAAALDSFAVPRDKPLRIASHT